MKVGILTYHRSRNAGAFWQTYATQSLLGQMGHDTRVIDYCAPIHRYHPVRQLLRAGTYRHPRYAFDMFVLDRVYARARRKFLHTTTPCFDGAACERLSFDAVVVGSDVVWDFAAPRRTGQSIYFGEHLNTRLRIAFAASCGPTSADAPLPAYVREGLMRFDAVSVRDENTRRFVTRCRGDSPAIVLDPCFHMDPAPLLGTSPSSVDYVAVYDSRDPGPRDFQAIRTFALDKKCALFGVGYRKRGADRNFVLGGPLTWLNVLAHARAIVTNTFHGSVFALLLGKPFALRLDADTERKTLSMLHLLKLESVCAAHPAEIAPILDRGIDASATAERIAALREAGRSFLESALR